MSYGFPGHADGKESACNAGDLIKSVDPEDPLEKEMTTHSSNLAWILPGESHGQRNLVGYSPWGCKGLDITE